MNEVIRGKMVDVILMDEHGMDITDLVKDMVYNGVELLEIAQYMNMPEEDVREIIGSLEE